MAAMITSSQPYRVKTVVIEAIPFRGDNWNAVMRFVGSDRCWSDQKTFIVVPTPEGEMRAEIGDWIIQGVKGEFYPCKPDIFEATFEPAYEMAG